MSILLIIIFIWLIIDTIRYIRYQKLYNLLNNLECNKALDHKNIKKYIDDLNNYPEIVEDNIKDIYYSRVSLEDMNIEDVREALYSIIGQNIRYTDDINEFIKNYKNYQKSRGRKIFEGTKNHKRIMFKKDPIKAWFPILPLYILTNVFNWIISTYMILLGYKYHHFPDGLKIWYNKYDSKKKIR